MPGELGMTKSCRIAQHSLFKCKTNRSSQILEVRGSLTAYADGHVLLWQLWEMPFTAKSLGFE